MVKQQPRKKIESRSVGMSDPFAHKNLLLMLDDASAAKEKDEFKKHSIRFEKHFENELAAKGRLDDSPTLTSIEIEQDGTFHLNIPNMSRANMDKLGNAILRCFHKSHPELTMRYVGDDDDGAKGHYLAFRITNARDTDTDLEKRIARTVLNICNAIETLDKKMSMGRE